MSTVLDTPLVPAAAMAAPLPARSRSYWTVVARQLRREPVTLLSAALLLLIVGASSAAPWLVADPFHASMLNRLQPIGSPGHLLGTDELGRDMLARLVHGGRLSLLMGVLPVLLAFVIGTSVGLFAGYVGGRTNMRSTCSTRFLRCCWQSPSPARWAPA
jgi:peptide/nickel transport system permease protein